MKFTKTILSTAMAFALIGCGGGGGNSDDDDTVAFTLAISDAPVDNLDAVYVCFSNIELKGNAENENNTFNNSETLVGTTLSYFDEDKVEQTETITACLDDDGQEVANSVSLDLLKFQGSSSINLLQGKEIHVGNYSQIRLEILPYSYAVEDDETLPVRVPSNELKLDGFTATQGNNVSFTIEFDLRKGMTDPVGQEGYILKPRGVRLVDNNLAGHIEGIVDESLLINAVCTDSDLEEDDFFVYLYSGHDLDEDYLSDNDGSESILPVASVKVTSEIEDQGPYSYEIGFVSVGEYTVGLTCSEDYSEQLDDLIFIDLQEGTVVEKQTIPLDFTAQ